MIKRVPFFLALLFVVSCANTSVMQTARVMEPGSMRVMGGLGIDDTPGYLRVFNRSDDDNHWADYSLPNIEGDFRWAPFRDWEFGGKLTILGTISADAKYQLWVKGPWAMAVGGVVGFVLVTPVDPDGGSENFPKSGQIAEWDFILPLYLSYDFSPYVTLYGVAKYDSRVFEISYDTSRHDAVGSPDETIGKNLLGGNLGVRVGREMGVFAEIGALRGINWNYTELQFSTAFYMKLGSHDTLPAGK